MPTQSLVAGVGEGWLCEEPVSPEMYKTARKHVASVPAVRHLMTTREPRLGSSSLLRVFILLF